MTTSIARVLDIWMGSSNLMRWYQYISRGVLLINCNYVVTIRGKGLSLEAFDEQDRDMTINVPKVIDLHHNLWLIIVYGAWYTKWIKIQGETFYLYPVSTEVEDLEGLKSEREPTLENKSWRGLIHNSIWICGELLENRKFET